MDELIYLYYHNVERGLPEDIGHFFVWLTDGNVLIARWDGEHFCYDSRKNFGHIPEDHVVYWAAIPLLESLRMEDRD